MLRSNWKTPLLGLALVVLGTAIAGAQVTKQSVRGPLAAVDEDSDAEGRFKIKAKSRRGTLKAERLEVDAKDLDTTADEEGNRPEYDVWLIDAEENASEFGTMRLRRSGNAQLRFSTRKSDLPEGVDELRDFGGGTIEIRVGDDVVLSGDIPEFVDPDGDGASRSRAKTSDRNRLSAVDEESRAKGKIKAVHVNKPVDDRETIVVKCKRLERGERYTIVAIDDEDAETEIGQFTALSRLGIGVLVLDTRQGTDIPGGSVLDLSGQDVEVRDSEGTAVLTGKFPRL